MASTDLHPETAHPNPFLKWGEREFHDPFYADLIGIGTEVNFSSLSSISPR